ncbi:MAG: CDP-alcohol phosphatidyltransferase family protein [Oscillospiraceae bacterium]|jgi:cardiolipin synthase|nr:CDP-alcohol phosphatidyltransferase family protein [Oscillospiraceae bacterium]
MQKKIVKTRKDFGKILNLPNILTFSRILLIFPFSFFMANENYARATLVLVVSAVTDFFDGILARYGDQQTQFGAMFDPIADKLTLLAVMFCVGVKFRGIVPFMIILTAKELCMLLAGAWLVKIGQKPLKARWYGKLGTAFFYFSVSSIVALKAIWNIEDENIILLLMGLTAFFMFCALIRYFCEFLKILVNNKKSKIQ